MGGRNKISAMAAACAVLGLAAAAAPGAARAAAAAPPAGAAAVGTSAAGGTLAAGGTPAVALPFPGIGVPGVYFPAGHALSPASASPSPAPAAAPAPPTSAECLAILGIPCYSPLQVERAYDLPPLYARGLTGRGRTIVIVDAGQSPTIRHDLRVFDDAFGIAAPPSLRIVQPLGPVPPFDPGNPAMLAEASEITGDVETAHEIAPGANILLVEGKLTATTADGQLAQAMTAENDVINSGVGDVFSQSFGTPEPNLGGPAAVEALRFAYRNAYRHHVTMLAASGDSGATGPTLTGTSFDRRVVYWPASDPLVTGVGGTELHLAASGRRTSPDTVWNDNANPVVQKLAGPEYLWAGGGGLSAVFGRPWYQDPVRGITGQQRGVPDVAMSASLSGAVLAYESFTGAPGRWGPGGGTSLASPLFAGVVAIADQYAHARLGLINPALYALDRRHAPGLVDVTQGNNTVSFTADGTTVTVDGFPALRGYDLASGVGTVDAARLVPELARAALRR
jgi:subtilase family serine protease